MREIFSDFACAGGLIGGICLFAHGLYVSVTVAGVDIGWLEMGVGNCLFLLVSIKARQR